MISTRVALSLQEIELFDPSIAGLGQGRGELRALCPLCGAGKPRDGAHRCLSINRQTGAWRCHRCGESGKIKEMWEQPSPLSRRERARQGLARIFDAHPTPPLVSAQRVEGTGENQLELSAQQPEMASWKRDLRDLHPLDGTSGALYLHRRGLSFEEASVAGARFCACFLGRPAVVFPLRDQNGGLRGAHARYVDGRDRPKARTLGDKRQSLFTTRGALDLELPALILTEAPLDALSLAEAGYPAVAVCGTQAPTWMHRACAFRRVLLAFDADDAGDRAADALTPPLESFGARCERLRPENAKDWNEVFLSGRDALADWLALRIL